MRPLLSVAIVAVAVAYTGSAVAALSAASPKDRAAAKRFLAAGTRLAHATIALPDPAKAIDAQYARCSDALAMDATAHAGEISRWKLIFSGYVHEQKVSRNYDRFAAELRRVRTSSPVLHAFRRPTATIRREQAKYRSARFDVCALFLAWQRVGWPDGFADRWTDRLLERAHFDEQARRAAVASLWRVEPRLVQLGLSQNQALSLTATAALH